MFVTTCMYIHIFETSHYQIKMKKLFLSLALVAFAGSTAFAQSTVWKSDNSHSSIGFEVDHMVISETEGEFSDFTVTVKADKEDFTDAQYEVVIQTASIDTDNEQRDGHLKSEDFFNTAEHPTITFKGSKFKQVDGKNYTVTGELTMHGVTKTVTLDAKFNGIIVDPWGNTRAGLKISGDIDRAAYGLTYNSTMEAGGVLIGEEVRLDIDIELIKQ